MGHWYVKDRFKLKAGFHDVFGLYGRPDRYNWDERNPRSLFFAYPKGPDRNALFLTTDEAITADHRAPNLPSILAQFVNILRRKLEQPPQQQQQSQYPNEKTPPVPSKNSPRNDDFRLPSMPFEKGAGAASPSYSDHSRPRSLSPITERTDIASRNNSQRTEKSVAFPNERQAQSKQGSGSSKLSPTREQTHLESIPDADSHGGHAAPSTVPMVMPVPANLASDMHRRNTGGTMQTEETTWSQSSANTPVAQRNAGVASLTGATAAMNMNDTQQTQTSPLSAGTSIHSPIPRKVSAGEIAPNKMDLYDEPAARYLMEMVDDAPAEQSVQPPPTQPVPPKTAEPERVRPTIITDSSKSPPPLGRKPSGARAIPVKKSANPRLNSVEDVRPDDAAPRTSTYEYEDAHAYLAYAEEPSPIASTGSMGKAAGVAAVPGIAGAGAAALPKEEYAKITEHVEPAPEPTGELSQDQVPAQTPPVVQKEEIPIAQPSASGSTIDHASQQGATAMSPVQQNAIVCPEQPSKRQTSLRVLPPVPQSAQNNQSAQQAHPSSTTQPAPPVQLAQPVQQPQSQQEQPYRQSSPARPQPSRDYDGSRRGSEAMMPTQYQQQQQQQRSSQFEPPQPSYMERPRSRSPGGNQMPQRYEPPQAPFMDQPRSRSPGMPQHPQPQHRSSSYSLRQNALAAEHAPTSRPQPSTNASRQTMWNANFASGHGMPEANKSGKFVELDEPQAQLTKAFAPHGLLQAGLQDKEERSAKKQEELAREMGSSLVNVPSKPPPPSAGLLGAVAQHEKERKGAGGIGATLTDREREKRLTVG